MHGNPVCFLRALSSLQQEGTIGNRGSPADLIKGLEFVFSPILSLSPLSSNTAVTKHIDTPTLTLRRQRKQQYHY